MGGRGVERDHLKAAKYLSRAADQGNVDAMVILGRIYAEGSPNQGVAVDDQKALEYFQIAAEQVCLFYENCSVSSWTSCTFKMFTFLMF